MTRAGFLAFSLVLSGCSLSATGASGDFDAAADTPQSVCVSDASCPAAAECVQGFCAIREGRIDRVLLAITPLAGNSPSEVLVAKLTSLAPGGIVNTAPLQVVIPPPIAVVGRAEYLDKANGYCDPSMRILFSPHDAVYRTEPGKFTTYIETTGEAFSVDLREGTYDVYAEAVEGSAAPCLPVFMTHTVESTAAAAKPLQLPLAPGGLVGYDDLPSFKFRVMGEALEGWAFKLVEPDQGRVVSNKVVLKGGGVDGAYPVELHYHHAGRAGYDARGQWIVAQPPEGSEIIQYTWWRYDIELLGSGADSVKLPASGSLRTVNLTLGGTDGEPQPGWISLYDNSVADLESPLPKSRNTGFERHVPVEPEGLSLRLLPGEYSVFAMPDSGEMQAREYGVTVADSAGLQSLEIDLSPRARLSANVTVPVYGQSQSGLPVALEPAPLLSQAKTAADAEALVEENYDRGAPKKYLGGALNFQPATALRGSVATTDDDGAFAISADTAESVLSIRPPVSTGLPWYVRPGVFADVSQGWDRFDMPLPLVYSGQLFGPDGEVLEARVEAYVYVDVPDSRTSQAAAFKVASGAEGFILTGAPGIGLMPVGETQSGPDGRFTLLLPPQLY